MSFDLTAVNGLAPATLVGPEGEIASQSFDGTHDRHGRFAVVDAEAAGRTGSP